MVQVSIQTPSDEEVAKIINNSANSVLIAARATNAGNSKMGQIARNTARRTKAFNNRTGRLRKAIRIERFKGPLQYTEGKPRRRFSEDIFVLTATRKPSKGIRSFHAHLITLGTKNRITKKTRANRGRVKPTQFLRRAAAESINKQRTQGNTAIQRTFSREAAKIIKK